MLAVIILISNQLHPSTALLARPTFGGLWSQYCLKDGHVLWEYMSFRMTFLLKACLKGGHALQEEMSCVRSCVGGVLVFMMAYLAICFILLVDISYWMT